MNYYLANEAKQSGPFKDIAELIASGLLNHNSLVWKAGMPNWTKASELTELKPYFLSVPPPLPVSLNPPPIPISTNREVHPPIILSEETDIGERCVGFVLDIICYSLLASILNLLLNMPQSVESFSSTIILLGCECIVLSVYGKTPSKFLFKTKVVKNDHSPITFLDAIQRSLIKYLLCIVSVLWCALGKERRFLHNQITSVIKET